MPTPTVKGARGKGASHKRGKGQGQKGKGRSTRQGRTIEGTSGWASGKGSLRKEKAPGAKDRYLWVSMAAARHVVDGVQVRVALRVIQVAALGGGGGGGQEGSVVE